MRRDDLTPAIRLAYASRAASKQLAVGIGVPSEVANSHRESAEWLFSCLGVPFYGRPGERSPRARRCLSGTPTLVRSARPIGVGRAVRNPNRLRHIMTTSITVLTTEVRQLDGLYSLNDLHKAAGGDAKHRPNYFLGNEQTKALVAEIEIAGIPAISSRPKIGTYVCKELVYAYAMWISPKFNLAVIRAFDAAQNVTPVFPTSGRWLAYADDAGRIVFKPAPHDALIVSPAQLAERIAEPGGWMLSNAELAAIAQAATARLAQRLIPTDQRRAA